MLATTERTLSVLEHAPHCVCDKVNHWTPDQWPPPPEIWNRLSYEMFLVGSEDGETARQATAVRCFWSDTHLVVRFDCEDRDIRATYTKRDSPVYQEEAVEVFL